MQRSKLKSIIIALAACANTSTAHAQSKVIFPSAADGLANAFDDICVKNVGNAINQQHAAISSPWNFKKSEESSQNRTILTSLTSQISINYAEGMDFCIATTVVSEDFDLAQLRMQIANRFGVSYQEIMDDEEGFYWVKLENGKKRLFISNLGRENPHSLTSLSFGIAVARVQ